MPLRIVAVGAGYLLYLLLESEGPAVGAGLCGAGSIVVAWTAIDRFTLRRTERLGPLQMGTTILGLGLIATGLYLVLR